MNGEVPPTPSRGADGMSSVGSASAADMPAFSPRRRVFGKSGANNANGWGPFFRALQGGDPPTAPSPTPTVPAPVPALNRRQLIRSIANDARPAKRSCLRTPLGLTQERTSNEPAPVGSTSPVEVGPEVEGDPPP